MSSEHQQYSIKNQSQAIRQCAERRGMTIVSTYADSGKSGLRIDGREALQELIHDVESGQADFEAILVYDVSRWGRFQDADDSAYYEYICRRTGIGVHYCAEQSDNDGSPVATIVKGVKRAMAAEYSRELSAKVFAGQCRLIELGFRQGGAAGFGLRRMLLDQTGNPKRMLAHGEHKRIQTDRVSSSVPPVLAACRCGCPPDASPTADGWKMAVSFLQQRTGGLAGRAAAGDTTPGKRRGRGEGADHHFGDTSARRHPLEDPVLGAAVGFEP